MTTRGKTRTVVIIGGGVAGLSAAQELLERGFDVNLYEKQGIPGGKARSLRFTPEGENWARGLPAEHGFRFFPGFYSHVTDTMKRIPVGDGRMVFDNLVQTTEGCLAQFGAKSILMPTRFPRSIKELKTAFEFFAAQVPVPQDEMRFWQERIWQILTSCEARRFDEYERIPWWNFIGAGERSKDYQRFLGNLSRTLVAAVPQRASTKTNGDVLVQLLLDMIRPGTSSDRVLNGPTNEVWIYPWLKYLLDGGPGMGRFTYHIHTIASEVIMTGGKVGGICISPENDAARVLDCGRDGISRKSRLTQRKSFVVKGDYYISAIPVEQMARLLHEDIISAHDAGWTELAKTDPTLKPIVTLARCTEWMNGIIFYLKRDVPLVHGHTIYVDPPWALTSISQKQFWQDIDLSRYGDGKVRGILSVDVSNWREANGRRSRKPAYDCTPEQIRDEVWADIKDSFRHDPEQRLPDWHHWYLDQDLSEALSQWSGIHAEDADLTLQYRILRLENAEPLLVNEVNTWRLRPNASTEVPNFFLAADYVRTHTDLATMEAANEAARRAVNAILDSQGSRKPRCLIVKPELPLSLEPLRLYDKWRYDRGLPWKGKLPVSLRVFEAFWQFGTRTLSGGLSRR